ncbi:MAG: hypothetical protein B7Y07_09070, partial [Halothiobacillus sp. 24-54-40]
MGFITGLAVLFFTLFSPQVLSTTPDTAYPGGIGGTGLSANAQPGGIGGTGIVAIGPIQRFGSIFVLGKEYHFTPNTRFTRDGQPSREQAQQLGDWVAVQGHWQENRWVADRVDTTHAITGKIESIDPKNLSIRVLGQEIKLAPNTQLHAEPHHVALYFSALKVGDVIRISAAPGRTGQWLATGIVRLAEPSKTIRLHLQGRVQAITPDRTQLKIQGVWLNFSGTMPQTLEPNQPINAVGHYRNGAPIITRIESIKPLNFTPGQAIELFGYTQQIDQNSYCASFKIKAAPGKAGLIRNDQAHAAGAWHVITGTLLESNVIDMNQFVPSQAPMQFGLTDNFLNLNPPSTTTPAANPDLTPRMPQNILAPV